MVRLEFPGDQPSRRFVPSGSRPKCGRAISHTFRGAIRTYDSNRGRAARCRNAIRGSRKFLLSDPNVSVFSGNLAYVVGNVRACPTARWTLVYRRSRRQARACSHRADAGLGENRNRRVDDGRVRDRWPRVPPCEPRARRHWGTPKNINLISGVGSLHKSPIWRAVKQRGRKTSTATLLANGNVVFAGGSGDSGGGNGAYLFDPTTESFTATGSMSVARLAQSATLQGDGTVLIAGGQVCPGNGTCPALASVEIYDPGAGTFSTTGSMLAARRFLGAPLLPDGTVLIAGGFGGVPQIPGQAPSTTAELYHPANPIKAPASFTNSSTGQAVLWNSVIGLCHSGRSLRPGTSGRYPLYLYQQPD